jgi:hypothetical protein
MPISLGTRPAFWFVVSRATLRMRGVPVALVARTADGDRIEVTALRISAAPERSKRRRAVP